MSMSIVDIPEQVARVLKYSLRSKSSFIFSLLTASVVLGFAWTLLYEFFYTRVYGKAEAQYGTIFWIGLGVCGAFFPLVYGAVTITRAWLQTRPFETDKFGIAIAAFDVLSVDPDTLGTAGKLGALDEAMRQYFTVARRASRDAGWLDEFDLRFLPPYVRIETKEDAERWKKNLNATLIVWGQIIIESKTIRFHEQNFVGTKLEMKLSGNVPINPELGGNMLALYALTSAGFILRDRNKLDRAKQMFGLAISPARKLDEKNERSGTQTYEAMLQGFISELSTPKKPAGTAT
jgi:hypothetical protein